MMPALDPHAAHHSPCVCRLLTGHFLAEPERPLGLPRASISSSPQPVFNTKRGKGGISGGLRRGLQLWGRWRPSRVKDPPEELWRPGLLHGGLGALYS